MSIFRLAVKEAIHRWLAFVLALLSVAVAVGTVAGVFAALRSHEAAIHAALSSKEAALEAKITKINNDIRSAMAKLGFNITILPSGQNLGDWYAEDYASKYMPENSIDKLVGSGVRTIEHLVPFLRQKVKWPEKKWTVLVVGRGDTVAMPASSAGDMPFEPVPTGKVVLGHEIHRALDYKAGDTVVVMERQFEVHRCSPEMGSKDDVTMWLDLRDAQELLGKEGLINEIRALETRGSWSEISKVRSEIAEVLPGAKVVEVSDLAATKTMARTKAIEKGEASILQERESRQALKESRMHMAFLLVPSVLLICTGWLGLLSFRNVRDRKVEIGTLMALGYSSDQVLRLFLLRSLALAVIGGVAGVAIGSTFGLIDYGTLGIALGVAAGLTAVATCGPAVRASRQDPADTIRGN